MHQAGQTALAQRWEGTTWLIGIQSEVSWLSAHVHEPCPSGSDSSYQQHTCMLSCSTVSDSATPWTAATLRASLSMGLSKPFPLPGDLLDPGIEPVSPALADGFFTIWAPGKPSQQQSGLLSSAGSVTFPQADLFLLQIQYPYSIFVQYCNLEVIHLCKVVA